MNKYSVVIREWDNFAHNVCQASNFLYCDKVVFACECELNEFEIIGFSQCYNNAIRGFKGLDIICKFSKLNDVSKIEFDNDDIYTEHYKDELLNKCKYYYIIDFDIVKRYEKSKLWRFMNRRKCEFIIDNLIYR